MWLRALRKLQRVYGIMGKPLLYMLSTNHRAANKFHHIHNCESCRCDCVSEYVCSTLRIVSGSLCSWLRDFLLVYTKNALTHVNTSQLLLEYGMLNGISILYAYIFTYTHATQHNQFTIHTKCHYDKMNKHRYLHLHTLYIEREHICIYTHYTRCGMHDK